MSTINPQEIINSTGGELQGGETNFIKAWIILTAASAMNVFMIYIFFSVFLLFLGRTLGLMIIGILSPLAFASILIPGMKDNKYSCFLLSGRAADCVGHAKM